MQLTFEAWKKQFVEILINQYEISKKKVKKFPTEVMKDYHNADVSPENAAVEESPLLKSNA